MKRSSKILSIALALLMVIPMFAFVPLEADAASKRAHTFFNNQFDFEDADAGDQLSDRYLNRRLDDGFSVTIPSSADNAGRRYPRNYTVMQETVGDETNNYIAPNFKYESAAMPTIVDETGALWSQRWQLTFKIKGENGSISTSASSPSGYTWGALIAVSAKKDATDLRESLLYAQDMTLAFGSDKGTPLCTLAKNQWHEITMVVMPSTGKVDFRVKQITFDSEDATNVMVAGSAGTVQSDGSVTGSRKVSGIASKAANAPTEGLVSMGRFYGSVKVDFCFDDIALQSVLSEHVDFEDALIRNAGVKDVYPATDPKYFLAKDMSVCAPGAAQTAPYTLIEDANGNMYHKMELVGLCGGTCGLYTNTKTLVTEAKDFEISARFMHDGAPFNNAFNAVRFLIGSAKFTPLNLNYGRVGIRGDAGIALFRRTETDGAVSYSTIQMTKGEWYDFDLKFDYDKWTYQVYMNGELLYLKGSYNAETNTASYPLDVTLKTKSQTYSDLTDADMTSTLLISALGGAVPSSALSVYFMYGTNNFGVEDTTLRFYADDYKISNTEAGGSYNKVVDFEYEPEIASEKVDWWTNTSLVNSWTKSADTEKKVASTLQDWDVVADPAENGTRGNVIHRFKADTDTTAGAHAAGAAIFSVRDKDNILPNYVVDISFDMYIVTHASANINLFKVYPKGVAAESRDNTNSFTVAQLNGGSLWVQNAGDRTSGTKVDTNTWYNMRFRVNFIEGWCEMYFNGSDTPYSFTVGGETKTRQTFTATRAAKDNWTYSPDMLDQLQFEIYSTWKTASSGDYYIDNIKVESVGVASKPKAALPDAIEYEIMNADFEDSDWLTKVKAGEISYVSMDYTKASILENAGVAGNSALLLTGTSGGAMDVDLWGMGGYHNTFSVEMSVSYGNPHGSALDLAILSDSNLSVDKTLLSVMGDNARDELTGTFFFNDDGNRYYLCDYEGNYYYSGNGDAEATVFTDVAIVVNAESDSYAVYINQKPAYCKAYGEADTLARASNIPLGMKSGKAKLSEPLLSLVSCSSDKTTMNKVLVDNISVASIKNGLTPVLVGYQENMIMGETIRLLATIDTLYYEETGFIVEAKGVARTVATPKVFTAVTANGSEIVARELDGRYITALVITDIDETVEFTVTPYAIFFGEEIRGETQVYTYTAE